MRAPLSICFNIKSGLVGDVNWDGATACSYVFLQDPCGIMLIMHLCTQKLLSAHNIWNCAIQTALSAMQTAYISGRNSFCVNPSLCVLKVCVESGSALMNGVPVLGAGGERGEAHRGHIWQMNALPVLHGWGTVPVVSPLKPEETETGHNSVWEGLLPASSWLRCHHVVLAHAQSTDARIDRGMSKCTCTNACMHTFTDPSIYSNSHTQWQNNEKHSDQLRELISSMGTV